MNARPRDLVLIALIAAALYAALMAIWPLAARPYTIALAEVGDIVFGGGFGQRGWVDVNADLAGGARRIEFVLSNTQREVSDALYANSRYLGWRPMALTAGLILATPLFWRRRLEALLLGLALIQVPVFIRMGLHIAVGLARPGGVEALDLAPGALNVLGFLDSVVGTGLANKLIEPIIVWAAVAFRPAAWSWPSWTAWSEAERAGARKTPTR